jgi:hypothetical protein
MRRDRMRGFVPGLLAGLVGGVCLFGFTPAALAATQCDTAPGATGFQATVNPAPLNKLLASLGNQDVDLGGGVTIAFQGLCVRHEFVAFAELFIIPLDQAPFTVTPSPGAIQVDLSLLGPFNVGMGTRQYVASSCDSTCVVEIPYVGEVFNGCSIESAVVGPIVGGWSLSASWDDIIVTQVADTCVLGDCSAIHPLESTTADVVNFDISGAGSCNVSLDFPDPLPDLSLDVCAGIDSLIASLVVGPLESLIENIFVTPDGKGVLIEVFHRDIIKDGCNDIPEVRACWNPVAASAGQIRGPRSRGFNLAFYALPLALAFGLTLRLRRRSGR